MGLKIQSRRWLVLNYVLSEPGEWTARSIADDIEEPFTAINEARMTLTRKGFIALGERVGRSYTLLPTVAGERAFQAATPQIANGGE